MKISFYAPRSIITLLFFCCPLFLLTTSFTPPCLTHKENKWLPDDFNPKDVILLIQEHPFGGKQNDRMIAFLEKEYQWRYEIVSLDQMNKNKKYEDKKLYKFAMLWSDNLSPEITTSSHGFTYHDIDGHFFDRSTDTGYPQSKLGKGFGQIGYRKVIKAINKKFKGIE